MPTLSNFLGGLYVPDYFGATIPSNALLRAENIEYNPSGGVRGRRGRVVYATVPGVATSLWRHYPRTGSPAFLAAIDSGSSVTIRHDTASNGTFTPVSGGGSYATGKRFVWTNWGSKDRSFGANGDKLLSYNGVITEVVQTGPQITGPYIVVHQSRLFGTKPSEINYSVYASDINDETTVSPQNQLNVSDPQGGSITGLASIPDRLVIFKNTSIWTMLGDIRYSSILTKLSEIGSIAPYAQAQAPYGIFFVGRQGIYLTDGVNPSPVDLSGPLRPLFTPAASTHLSYPNAVGLYYPRKDQYHVKLDPGHPHTYVLSRIQKVGEKGYGWAWAMHTPTPLVTAATWDSEGDTGNLYFADGAGKIFRADVGFTDEAALFTSVAQTAALRLDERQRVGRVSYCYLTFQGRQPATVGLRYDNSTATAVSLSLGASQTLGLQRARAMVVDQAESGQFVSAVVTLPQDGPEAELYSLRLDTRLRAARVWR
jgi:hypothetical protein